MKRITNKICKLSLIGLLLQSTYILAQEEQDFAIWSGLELNYEFDDNWELSVEGQLRTKENSSLINQYFGQAEVQRKLFKGFNLGIGVRYIRKNDTKGNIQGYENFFRYHVQAQYKHNLDRFSLRYRIRFQSRNELGVSSSEGDDANQRLRFKLGGEYNFSQWKLDPVFSVEVFNQMQKNNDEDGFNRYRLSLGTNYKLSKRSKIGLFYKYQNEFNVSNPEAIHIANIKYSYTIK